MGVVGLPDALLDLSTAVTPGAPGVTDGMARSQHTQPSLAVAGPHFGAQHRPDERAAYYPIHDDWALIIEPHQMGCPAPDEVANEAVISVDHPGVGRNGETNPPYEFIRVGSREVSPAGLPIHCVEF